jgi:hypothetical protein
MTTEQQRDAVLRLIRTASDRQQMPTDGHFLDDEEVVACWEEGLLSPSQQEEIIAHLSNCPACRRRLAGMIRRGDIAWGEPEPVEPPAAPTASRPATVRRHRGLLLGSVVVLAASLLGIVGVSSWLSHRHPRGGGREESSLALRGKVTDYGYLLDGQSATKAAFPVVDPVLKQRQEELLRAIEANPADAGLRIEYGEVLLRAGEPEKAETVFHGLLDANPADPAAHLGLGLARFLEGRLDEALTEFDLVLKGEPRNVAAHLNAAACLARLGRIPTAETHWQAALQETHDSELRSQIEQTLHRQRRPTDD